MSDEPDAIGAMSETQRNGAQPQQAQWISVQEAAGRLGITERAVQTRAQRGQIVSKRQGRAWLICLEATPDLSSREPQLSATAETNETQPQLDATRTQSDETQQPQQPQNDVVDLLKSENAFLRSRIEEHEAQIRRRDEADHELRMLMLADKNELQMLRQKVSLMLAAPPVEEPVQETPQGAQETRTAQVETNAGISAPVAETSQKSEDAQIYATSEKSGVTVWDVPAPRKAWWKFWDRQR